MRTPHAPFNAFSVTGSPSETYLSPRNPVSIVDQDGRVGIDFGVYGVPETFVVDKQGVIRFKQIGPVTAEALDQKILPLVRELQKS